MEEIETQPEEIIEERPEVSILDKIKSYKFKILGGVLGVLVVAGAVFGAYRLGQRQTQPTPQLTPTPEVVATPTPDPTANWETYTNTEYGYSIKYPEDWVLQPDKQAPDEIVNFMRDFSSLRIYSGGAHTAVSPSAVLSEIKSVTVAGQEATKEVYEGPYGEEGLFEWIKFSEELKVGQIALYKHGEGREHSDTLNLMLSTFRFLEEEIPTPSPTTIEKISYRPIPTWQTYNDSQASFSVQYPESYKLSSSTPGKEVIFWSCFDDPQKGEICMSGYMIRVYENYDGGSRRAWFENLRPNFLIDPYYEDVIVAGIKSLIIMDGNLGGSTGSFVLIPKGNKMFLFDFPGGWNPDTKEKPGLDFIKQILSTFRFLD